MFSTSTKMQQEYKKRCSTLRNVRSVRSLLDHCTQQGIMISTMNENQLWMFIYIQYSTCSYW